MSGAASLKGLVYQQRYVTYRVLSLLSEQAIGTNAGAPTITAFSIEGKTAGDSPVWDVWISFGDGSSDFDECKDTAIDKKDRLTFYTRIRKEIALGTPATTINPVWVTDPDKQSPNALSFLEGIPNAVTTIDLGGVEKTLPERVASVNGALQEAVYQLCHDSEPSGDHRLCTFDEAREVLRRLRVDRHRFDALDQSIKLLSTGLLAQGIAPAILEYVTGTLTQRVVQIGQARFTPIELLQAVGTTQVTLEVGGRMRDLMNTYAGSGYFQPARHIRWTRCPALLRRSGRSRSVYRITPQIDRASSSRAWEWEKPSRASRLSKRRRGVGTRVE